MSRYHIRVPNGREELVAKKSDTLSGALEHRNHFRKVVSAGAYVWDDHDKRQVVDHSSVRTELPMI